MPYRRRYRRRRNYRRRGRRMVPWYKKRYNALQLASKAWSGVKYIRGLVNAEKFAHDVAFADTPDTTGLVTSLTAIAQADTVGGRTGNSILAKSLYGRFRLTMNSTAVFTFVRILVIRDDQGISDATPAIAQLLDSVTVEAPLAKAFAGRFTVLRDMVISLDDSKRQASFFKFWIPMQHHVRYNGTASTDIQKGGLYLVHLSNEAVNTPTLTGTVRLSYHDN